MVKTISILSIANSVLLAFDNNSSEGSLDHVSIVKACMNEITLLGHLSAEFERKRKNNLRNIVHTDLVTSCGSKQGSAASKVKPKNSVYLFITRD